MGKLHNDNIYLYKKAIRIINNKQYRTHTEPLFKANRILRLCDQHEHQILLFMYQYVNNQLPHSFVKLFVCQNQPTRITRHNENIVYSEMPRIKFTECLPRHYFRKIWNKLDINIKNSKIKSNFNKTTKQNFINKYA